MIDGRAFCTSCNKWNTVAAMRQLDLPRSGVAVGVGRCAALRKRWNPRWLVDDFQ